MRRTTRTLSCVVALAGAALVAACRSPATGPAVAHPDPRPFAQDRTADRLARQSALDRRALVCAVLERNPDLGAAEEALVAARARARAPVAAGGTRLSWQVAPGSFGGNVPFGQIIEIEQTVRLGQRRLERDVARTDADALGHRREAVRNELALAAATLYDEHYALARALETNVTHRALVTELVEAATRRYAAGLAPAQDPLQADLELSRIEQERIEIEAEQAVVTARINRLLHRAPDTPLSPPPDRLGARDELSPNAELREQAFASRPDLRATSVEVDARARAVALSRRRFAPDLSVTASHNSMWPDIPHRYMVGVGLTIPLQVGALRAGVSAARADHRRAQKLAEGERDRIATDVEEAIARLRAAEETVRVYRERLVPTARDRVDAARIGYETAANDIDVLVDAERELRSVELGAERAIAELDRRHAELEWAVGIPPCPSEEAGR